MAGLCRTTHLFGNPEGVGQEIGQAQVLWDAVYVVGGIGGKLGEPLAARATGGATVG